ncbi:MAG: galactokinase [Bacteroidales bacterium]
MVENVKGILKRACELWGGDPGAFTLFYAPGRVNLLGEHIDYNGGTVLPFAISQRIWLMIRPNHTGTHRFISFNEPTLGEIDAGKELSPAGQLWFNYPLGVIHEFTKTGFTGKSFDFVFAGNIPVGSGLSSSAAIEMVTAVALNHEYQAGMEIKELVLLAQRAENSFIGMNCGIMDMYAIGMGRKGQVVAIDTTTNNHEWVPLGFTGYTFIVTDTRKPRKLAESAYNDRRNACGEVLSLLRKKHSIENLCEITPEEWSEWKKVILDPVLVKRAEHVIMEQHRVLRGMEMLRNGDALSFGQLMNESHRSLRDDYEVSCRELDILAETAWQTEGVAGSRMTGAGFGGCTITMVKKGFEQHFIDKAGKIYRSQIGHEPAFYWVYPSPGAGMAGKIPGDGNLEKLMENE